MTEFLGILISLSALFTYALWERNEWRKHLRQLELRLFTKKYRPALAKLGRALQAAVMSVGISAQEAAKAFSEALEKIGRPLYAPRLSAPLPEEYRAEVCAWLRRYDIEPNLCRSVAKIGANTIECEMMVRDPEGHLVVEGNDVKVEFVRRVVYDFPEVPDRLWKGGESDTGPASQLGRRST